MATNFKVNGRDYSVAGEMEDTSLLLYLRKTLRLTSVKNGCNEGHCGTCTVIINGKAKKSCLIKLKTLAGAEIETLEALSSKEAVHPVIYAYVMEGAVQCGFCTPGFIMATKALLQNNPSPSPEEVKKALSGNLCRCTG